ncbi:MAG: hypothetical protein ACR2M9_03310 [Cyanophyceae cyanobacterium]|jgi:hypothetical protein
MKFVQEDYDKYDGVAKDLLADHLIAKGYDILSTEEDFYHDVIAVKDGVKFYFEVEVKLGYPFTSARSFKFPTVSFTGRKLRLHKVEPFFYVIFCLSTRSYLYCHSSIIYNEKYAENVNIYTKKRKGMDKMYRIPKEFCTFVTL